MTLEEFKNYCLRTLCEAHLWKPLESDFFDFEGSQYRIMMEPDHRMSLTVKTNHRWNVPQLFPTMYDLMAHLFRKHNLVTKL